MENLTEKFLELREKMMEEFKINFEKHLELGEKEVPIRSFGPINGIYYEKGEKTYFVRPRINAGKIELENLYNIIKLSEKYGDGEIKLTTRQSIQFRGVKAENVINLIQELSNIGIYTQMVGGKTMRGIVTSAYTGFVKEEFNVEEYVIKTAEYFRQDDEIYKLPGKFKIAVSNSSEDTANGKYTDIGFIAKKIDDKKYFEVYFDFGMNLSMKNPYNFPRIIEAYEIIYYIKAASILFKENMEMTNPRARLRTMNRKLGEEKFLIELDRTLEIAKKEIDEKINVKELFKNIDDNYEKLSWGKKLNVEIDKNKVKNIVESIHQEGIYSIKIKFRGGVVKKGKLIGIVEYLKSLPHNIKLRISNNQEIIIFNLNGDEIEYICKNFDELLLETELDNSITCTGNPRCRLSLTSSKSLLDKIIREFGEDIKLKEELPQLRISGCPNSCSLTFKGDIGFSGRMKKVDDKMKIAYTLLSENKNIELAGRAVILESDIPKFIYELAVLKRESNIFDFKEFLSVNADKVNELIGRYV